MPLCDKNVAGHLENSLNWPKTTFFSQNSHLWPQMWPHNQNSTIPVSYCQNSFHWSSMTIQNPKFNWTSEIYVDMKILKNAGDQFHPLVKVCRHNFITNSHWFTFSCQEIPLSMIWITPKKFWPTFVTKMWLQSYKLMSNH